MKELIIIKKENGKQLVDGRELHGFLENGDKFTTWIQDRIKQYDFIENIDFNSFSENTEKGGRPRVQYALTISMAKELAMVERNEKGKQARQYFLECEKKLQENKPTCIEDLIIMQAQSLKDLRQQLNEVSHKVLEATQKVDETKVELQGIRDVVTLDTNNWREDTTRLINKIAQNLGGNEHIKDVRKEAYALLDKRMSVSLEVRLTNKRRRMADEGVCKSKRDKLNKMDVIADDKKLIEGYVAIVKEMVIKYGV